MTDLTLADMLRSGDFAGAVDRMQELCRIQDPESPVDAEAVRARYVEARESLKAVVPPAPFRVTVVRS